MRYSDSSGVLIIMGLTSDSVKLLTGRITERGAINATSNADAIE